MIVLENGKAITLEELAQELCHNISGADAGGCFDGSCPAAEYCRHGHNGMIDWLRKVLGNERD